MLSSVEFVALVLKLYPGKPLNVFFKHSLEKEKIHSLVGFYFYTLNIDLFLRTSCRSTSLGLHTNESSTQAAHVISQSLLVPPSPPTITSLPLSPLECNQFKFNLYD